MGSEPDRVRAGLKGLGGSSFSSREPFYEALHSMPCTVMRGCRVRGTTLLPSVELTQGDLEPEPHMTRVLLETALVGEPTREAIPAVVHGLYVP